MGFVSPRADASLEPFRDGVAVLTRDGALVGHVATTLTEFSSPLRVRRRQPWVWFIIVWRDGTRERPTEDYPPWTYVAEMKAGHLDWDAPGDRAGRYEVAFLPPAQATELRRELGIQAGDF